MLVVEICKYISATVFSRESEISEIGGYTRTALSQEASCTQISNICATKNSKIGKHATGHVTSSQHCKCSLCSGMKHQQH